MEYKEVQGDLIELANEGKFDVIAHGCNCFCAMGAGLAPQMARAYNADKFYEEKEIFRGRVDKLGDIGHQLFAVAGDKRHPLTVVNAYTQYKPGENFDIHALEMCLFKMNHIFKGQHIGLPQIGCGIGGGNWEEVKEVIQRRLSDCQVTVVIYNKNRSE